MSTICGGISANIQKSCTVPLQAGTRDRAVIFNFEDKATVVFNATNVNTIEDLTLAFGKDAFVIDGLKNSIAPMTALVPVGPYNMFDHTVKVLGFDISPAIKEQLNAMKDGKFIIVTENYFRGANGDSAFEVFGLTTGLELSILTRDGNNADTQGAFDMTFTTQLNKEPNLPNALFITSYALSKAVVDSLLV